MQAFALASIALWHFAARLAISALLPLSAASAQMPETIAAPGEALVARLHAEGAQIYECKAERPGSSPGNSVSRSPRCSTATRPSAGTMPARTGSSPTAARSRRASAAARPAPRRRTSRCSSSRSRRSAAQAFFPTSRPSSGIDTKGGVAEGACPTAGALLSVPYAADYVFLKKAPLSLLVLPGGFATE